MKTFLIDPWEAQRQAQEFRDFIKKITFEIRKRNRNPRSKRYRDLRHTRIAEDRFLMDHEAQDIKKREKEA